MSPPPRLVLVTGASEGIGRAAAREFARDGARVVAIARSASRLAELADELGRDRVIPIDVDVTDGAAMDEMARWVLDRAGVPDVVVANAGVGLDALVRQTSDEAMRHILDVNTVGVLRTVRPFIEPMMSRGSGRILIISSVIGKRGVPHYGAYSASKFALHGLADALRPELSATGVTVGIVCPSTTESEFSRRVERAGIRQNPHRWKRHPAEQVARDIVRMSRSRRREMICSPEGKLFIWVSRLAPGVMDRILGAIFRK